MIKFAAYLLPKRTFLFSRPVQIIVGNENIVVKSNNKDELLFSSSLKDLKIAEESEMSWLILQTKDQLVRLLFSNPSKIKQSAYVAVGLIIVGFLAHFPAIFALALVFLFFRPWLNYQESQSQDRVELLELLKDTVHTDKSSAAIDDLTKGTHKVFGGWREILGSVISAFFSSIFFTIAYFVGIYGSDRRLGALALAVMGASFAGFFIYYIALARPVGVEYYKKQQGKPNKFVKYLALYMLPFVIVPAIFVIAIATKA